MAVAALAQPGAGKIETPAPEKFLPGLREDLQLLPAPRQAGGAPSWNLYDPVRHLFYRIGWREFEILSRWHLGGAEQVAARVNRETTLTVTASQVLAQFRFLAANSLLQPGPAGAGAERRPPPLSRRLGENLFRRLALFHPDHFLTATLPLVRFFFARSFWLLTLAAGLLGLYLAGRQWQVFRQTFLYLFSMEGLVLFGLTLVLVKFLHELAHGYTAKRFGLRVPVIGVAFMLIWPLFYTDTTDAWRLVRKRERLAIEAAGVLVELAIGAYATLLWSFLAPGPLRSVAFLLATATWLQSLLVNLNPFMRFDGYYLLSDLWEVPNLQPRSFRLARWFLGRLLPGLQESCPERFPAGQRALLLLYALATWLYRLILFTSIGLLLYLQTFKLLGLFLLVAALSLFIGRPVLLELRHWWRERHQISLAALLRSGAGVVILLFLVLHPWQGTVSAPAVLKAIQTARIHPPADGRLVEVLVKEGQQVQKGELLFVLQSPVLDYQTELTAREAEALRLQLDRSVSGERAEEIRIVQQRLATALTTLAGYRAQQERLRIRASLAGTIVELAEALQPGRWLNSEERLALIADCERLVVEGYVKEQDLARLAVGQRGRFYPQRSEAPVVSGRLAAMDLHPEKYLSEPLLASFNGGGLAARQTPAGQAESDQPVYRFILSPEESRESFRQILRGTVRLEARPMNYLERFRLAFLRVFIRESGF